jgi:hypothetical protein
MVDSGLNIAIMRRLDSEMYLKGLYQVGDVVRLKGVVFKRRAGGFQKLAGNC